MEMDCGWEGKTSFAEKHVCYILLGSGTMMYPDVVARVDHPLLSQLRETPGAGKKGGLVLKTGTGILGIRWPDCTAKCHRLQCVSSYKYKGGMLFIGVAEDSMQQHLQWDD